MRYPRLFLVTLAAFLTLLNACRVFAQQEQPHTGLLDNGVQLSVQEWEQLEKDRKAALGLVKSKTLTLIAQHMDGTPARGRIACEGNWRKYQDLQPTELRVYEKWFPFETDARGAAIFDVIVGWYEDEEELLTCVAFDTHGHRGTFQGTVAQGDRRIIVVR